MFQLIIIIMGVIVIIAAIYIRYLFLLYSIPQQIGKARASFETDQKQAVAILDSILSVDRGHPVANWLMAHFHIKHTRYILALKFLNEIITFARYCDEVSEQDVRETISQLYLNLGNMEKALEQFNILQGKYDLPGSLIKKAVSILLEGGNIVDAKSLLERSINQHPQEGEYDYILATILFKEKEYIKAETKLESAQKKGYSQNDLYFLLGKIAYLNKNYTKALDALLQCGGKGVDLFEYNNMVGQLFYMKEDYRQAIDILESTLERIDSKNPNKSGILYYLALSYEKKGKIEKALELWKKVKSSYTKYQNAREKINFYENIAHKPYERAILSMPLDSFEVLSRQLADKMNYTINDTIRKNQESIEYTATSQKDTMFANVCYFVVNRSLNSLTYKDVKDIIIRKSINKCKFITITYFLIDDQAKMLAHDNNIEIHPFSIFKTHKLL
ncbi:MAG: tetratricopeptide repeat protein [Spirochaetes bacterium]|jgi:lipopolysaccharide biosynthesis regulator YciM|nr:tetratricopeptide repeat protein [Spirochaetota bacterium]